MQVNGNNTYKCIWVTCRIVKILNIHINTNARACTLVMYKSIYNYIHVYICICTHVYVHEYVYE